MGPPSSRAATQHGRWGCHRLSCVLPVHASPSISQATTQDPAWAVGLPPPVLRPHRKPPISRNDPARAVGLPPPVLHPHCPRKAPRSREQRPRTQQPHCPSCVHIPASLRFRTTTQHGRWGCHRPSFILHVSCPFRTPGSAVMGGGISTTYLCTSCSHWPPRIDLRPLTGW